MNISRILTLAILLGTTTLYAQEDSLYRTYVTDPDAGPYHHNVDMQHLMLDLRFEPEIGKVEGKASYTLSPLQQIVDTLFLHAPGISVNNVAVDGKASRFTTNDKGLVIYFTPSLNWETTHTLDISYTAHPKKGIYFVGWNQDTKDIADDPDRIRKQIWTQGQGTDNRHWIPSYDEVNDKLITELRVTFRNGYEVISNGNLKSREATGNNETTWHYAMEHPHANYLIMLAVGEYKMREYRSENGIVSRQYYYPDREDAVEPTYAYSDEMMDWMDRETGLAFPWSTYANVPVQEFLYGAMENTTATIFTDALYQNKAAQPDQSYVGVNAHELAHQWFGDYVTEWSGSDHWLQESFATHYAKKFREFTLGDDTYQWIKRQELERAIAADKRNEFPLAHSMAGSSRHYPKGSFVLDMMRYVLGNEQYRKVINDYLLAHPYENVRSSDLELQCMKTLGINMEWFFDQWVYRAGYPVFEVSRAENAYKTQVTVTQVQDTSRTVGLFQMPVVIRVHYTNGGMDEATFTISKRTETFEISKQNGEEVAFVLFDPGREILSEVNYYKPFEELRYQAFNASNMIDRYDALFAMRDLPHDIKREALQNMFARESFYAMKEEIIFQLADDEDKSSIRLLELALEDEDTRVRRAAPTHIPTLHKKLKDGVVALLEDENYFTIETALRNLYRLDSNNISQYLQKTKQQGGANKNVRLAWIEISMLEGNNASVNELTTYLSDLYEFRTRQNAMAVVRATGYCTPLVCDNLLNAAQSFNRRLGGVAKYTIKQLYKDDSNREVIEEAVARAIATGAPADEMNGLLEID
jgi:aminopeptidase N